GDRPRRPAPGAQGVADVAEERVHAATLRSRCEEPMNETPPAAAPRPIVSMRSRVLVVEDNSRTQEAIALYLRHAGYDVDLAATGAGAAALADDGQHEPLGL